MSVACFYSITDTMNKLLGLFQFKIIIHVLVAVASEPGGGDRGEGARFPPPTFFD